MINITQYTHFPNTTELGKGNTHECYLLIKRDHDLSNLFPPGEEIAVTEISTQKKYYFKSAQGNEFRINQLGVLYRDFDVRFGDAVTITNLGGDKDKTYVNITKYNRVVLYVTGKGVEILNEERLKAYEQKGASRNYRLNVNVDGEQNVLQISFSAALPKRADSPSTTDFYKAELNGSNLSNGTYALTLGNENELRILEKSSLKIFPFDEKMLSPFEKKGHTDATPSEHIQIQSTDAQEFVWDCVKEFYNAGVLEELLHSHWAYKGGNQRDYWVLNGCFCAYEVADPSYADNPYAFDDKWICDSFRVDGGTEDVKKFAEAVNDVLNGKYKVIVEGDNYKLIKLQLPIDAKAEFTPYLTALRTKPFMLLAGISGTGKSRIAREIAKACWPEGSKQRTAHMPENYCIVSVKPNWHDSTELIGYVSRINGKEKYVYGDFLPFVVKAWMNPSVPHILCLDEMNLAPVEQYFAEYLSAIESRESNNGVITTDPILKPVFSRDADGNAVVEQWYSDLIKSLLAKCPNETIYALTKQFEDNGITIPQNLFVIGTVNMDETTFSFSRKVLDRAMTLEMNKVDLEGGLAKDSLIGPRYIGGEIIGDKAKGADAYEANKALCDKVIEYLKKINDALENTPFKIAYRTRNEFLLYAVNRLAIDKKSEVWQTLDEMTSMKILSRIEGDEDRCKACLAKIDEILAEFLGEHFEESVSHKKIKEMQGKFKSGYTSYWT